LAYFAAEDYHNWLVAWEKTYELETDPARWAQLNQRLKTLNGRSAQQPEPAATAVVAVQQLPEEEEINEKNTQSPEPPATEIRRMLTQATAAMGKGAYQKAIELSRMVIDQEPDNLTAWENLGISYFAAGEYPKWVEAWEKIHALGKNTERWEALNSYLNALRRDFTPQQKAAAAQVYPRKTGPAPAQPEAVQPVIIRPAGVRQEDRQSLYNLGIDFYTSGELGKAKAAFEKLLQLDPGNEPAAKALKRVNEDLRE